MAVRDVLRFGNPLLTRRCDAFQRSELPAARAVGQDLHDTLMHFRASHGWGRAIAAPQIGVFKRVVYLQVDRPWLIINPVISGLSAEMMDLWDDCMSFPDLLVRVKRYVSLTLTFRDEKWSEHTRLIEGALSELLQHEIDHLDGILAVSRAVDSTAFALRSERHLLGGATFANS